MLFYVGPTLKQHYSNVSIRAVIRHVLEPRYGLSRGETYRVKNV